MGFFQERPHYQLSQELELYQLLLSVLMKSGGSADTSSKQLDSLTRARLDGTAELSSATGTSRAKCKCGKHPVTKALSQGQ